MVDYDPDIIQEFADRIYARTRNIIQGTAVLGAVAGAIGFAFNPVAGLLGVALGGLLGYLFGRCLAFGLKAMAHLALCQLKIEENTHPVEEEATIGLN